ncbi:hypothetical protein M378DRAFT_162327 [Amanita muscaria Koide BX008]|uniref:Uncharacterized protein n=1 Tax=Amanita muscaria (strain Koide BX008) TaxID=946122 RepID=A0A0C2X719_AMAMK|nr:hypothetical protein M378DRAFT_162327 [Amanita muscaria Koide BX008]
MSATERDEPSLASQDADGQKQLTTPEVILLLIRTPWGRARDSFSTLQHSTSCQEYPPRISPAGNDISGGGIHESFRD